MGPHVEARIEGKSYLQTAGSDGLPLELCQVIEEMLDRNLREDPYFAHAAEVRENIIPRTLFPERHFQPTPCETDVLKVRSDIHDGMDATPALYTFFLHEDLISGTLPHERDLKAYRLNEIKAGRGNPGRPLKVSGCQWPAFPSISKQFSVG